MLLRVLHTAAAGKTWYGRVGYSFGRAGFNISAADWRSAVGAVGGAALADLAADFEGVDAAAVAVISRYQGQGGRLRGGRAAGWFERVRGWASGAAAGAGAGAGG